MDEPDSGDIGDIGNGHTDHESADEAISPAAIPEDTPRKRPRELPKDLPTSLDDRKPFQSTAETEYYDAWQGQSQIISAPASSKLPSFSLALHDTDDNGNGDGYGSWGGEGNDEARVAQMMAASAAGRKGSETSEEAGEREEEDILNDSQLSHDQKAQSLQDILFMAASNGDVARVRRLVRGKASDLLNIDATDAEGTPPLVYASCFGHHAVVLALLDAGAAVDTQDRNQWTALMWAITNRHKDIAKTLLDHGASTDVKSSSGRTALDFVPPGGEMSEFLQQGGYSIGNVGVTDDFYDSGFSQDRLEEELAESEMRRRMMMESAMNLEVDLGNLGLDEQPESPDMLSDEDDSGTNQDFIWTRCLPSQMFVFLESDIERILNVVVTTMTPQRSASQKPVPANLIFLGARYAHYHATPLLLTDWLASASEKIYEVVDRHQWDMTILAFWISNCTLLYYYLRKDTGLSEVTGDFQAQMAELIHEIYILIIRDAERRMDRVLDAALLDHETIPGFEDIHFQNEWNFLRSKSKVVAVEPMNKTYGPPSPKKKAQVSPRNVTSLLSSTLFVLDLYDVHAVITAQVLGQLYYWLGAEVFNRIMSNKRYLARTKAMQIRMNVSVLEDWARANNRLPQPKEYAGQSEDAKDGTMEIARRYLGPLVQLLQWLQCFSSLREDKIAMEATLEQLPALGAGMLTHAVKHYRAEVGEGKLNKTAVKWIQEIKSRPVQTPVSPLKQNGFQLDLGNDHDDDENAPESNLLNPALLLPFHLPTAGDLLVSYGAGFGGMDRARERRYVPAVPEDILRKLDPEGGKEKSSLYEGRRFSDGDST